MKSGQALIVVLLVLAVTAAVGLSVVSRSVTEINLSSNQDASSQSLSAAESGIEAVLHDPSLGVDSTPHSVGTGSSSYQVTAKSAVGQALSYQVSNNLFSGEAGSLFLKEVDANGQIIPAGITYGGTTFVACWGTPAVAPGPSLEISFYTLVSGVYGFRQVGFNGTGAAVSGFGAAGSGAPCNSTERYRATVNIPAGSVLANFKLLYNTTVAHSVRVVSTAGNFPPQGQAYEVQGQTGQTSRRVSVSQTYPAPPSILDNALFSGGNL